MISNTIHFRDNLSCSYVQHAVSYVPERWRATAQKVHDALQKDQYWVLLILIITPIGMASSLGAIYVVVALPSLLFSGHFLTLLNEYVKIAPLQQLLDEAKEWFTIDTLWVTTALCVMCAVTSQPIFLLPVGVLLFIEGMNSRPHLKEYFKKSVLDFLEKIAKNNAKVGNSLLAKKLYTLTNELSFSKVSKKEFFCKLYDFLNNHKKEISDKQIYQLFKDFKELYDDHDIVYLEGENKHAIPKGLLYILCETLGNMVTDLQLENEACIPIHYPDDPKKAEVKDLFIRFLTTDANEKEITHDNVFDLLDMAHYYQFDWLEDECSNYIFSKIMNLQNICEIYNKAKQHNYKFLIEDVIIYISNNKDKLTNENKEELKKIQHDNAFIYYYLNKGNYNWNMRLNHNKNRLTCSISTDYFLPHKWALTDTSFEFIVAMTRYYSPTGSALISLKLERFTLQSNHLEQLLANPKITTLDIRRCDFADFTEAAANTLATHQTLKEFAIQNTSNERARKWINQALRANESLDKVTIQDSSSECDCDELLVGLSNKRIVIDSFDVPVLTHALLESPNLENLIIIPITINRQRLENFCSALALNQTLKTFSSKLYFVAELEILLEAVQNHSSLKEIYIQGLLDPVSAELQQRLKDETPNIKWNINGKVY